MRSNTRDASTGVSVGLSRGRFITADDTKKMQTVQIQMFHGEVHDGVEHWQPYGRSTVPLPPDPNSPKAAEPLTGYFGGSRSHPVVFGIADRRYRPTGGNPGEVKDYHYKGNAATWGDAGWSYSGGAAKLQASWSIGNAIVTIADGKITLQVGGTNGPATVIKSDGVYHGGDPDVLGKGAFDLVELVSGPSKNVYGLKS